MKQKCGLIHERKGCLPAPKPGESVWPRESCPAFTARKNHLPLEGSQCWYCKYADFHLTALVALEVGICRYPAVQLE